ncbi:ASN_HP2_G0050910.mRNA.1.CDS.1 [Saccharomyces cerevisiae]|nr:BAG_1a_G0052530.mRNA.1.CDS.1 [Saccharomyces cerevisiae]CAI4804618.1 BGN_3a_G0053160.mRNA.1.CDS.1 [Saccharomyces cerevisiae]CAI4828574.1 BAP_1a_G0053190.mRNA.1.CDS.1 [Saccharomyces cerevisiae]CAI4906575.1 CRE_HP_G0007080.mRNA.1.CDS.1 [Saccharomyces cerevisiae]CAI4914788.1 CRE_HP_G0012860.mRNA.1.CDS.1 [Saccharomyces cerevisiae]
MSIQTSDPNETSDLKSLSLIAAHSHITGLGLDENLQPRPTSEEEEVELSSDALDLLTKTGVETSLRYSSNLISVAQQIAMKRKNNTVEVEDVKRAYLLFLDSARSVKYVQENESQYIDDQGNVQISIAKSADPDAMDTTE